MLILLQNTFSLQSLVKTAQHVSQFQVFTVNLLKQRIYRSDLPSAQRSEFKWGLQMRSVLCDVACVPAML